MKNKKGWSADIGEYEKGINISLPGARNLAEAHQMAFSRVYECDHCQDPFVVQIYRDGKIVWDFTNFQPFDY